MNYNLYLISDATGETLLSLGRAVASQYNGEIKAVEHIYNMIREKKQLNIILEKINKNKGIVIYTMVNKDLSEYLEEQCKKIKVPCCAALNPLLNIFENYLNISPNRLVSAQHKLNENYFKRQEAINYSLLHDDGQLPNGLKEAEVILLGISRTSKTPTSLYLANRGIKTANIPIVLGVELPKYMFEAKNALIIGLIVDSSRLEEIRKNRHLGIGWIDEKYSNRSQINKELLYAKSIYKKYNIKIIDVTSKAVEEIAATILTMIEKGNYCEV